MLLSSIIIIIYQIIMVIIILGTSVSEVNLLDQTIIIINVTIILKIIASMLNYVPANFAKVCIGMVLVNNLIPYRKV